MTEKIYFFVLLFLIFSKKFDHKIERNQNKLQNSEEANLI